MHSGLSVRELSDECKRDITNVNFKNCVPNVTSHMSEWPSSKSLQITNVGKDVEKREPSYIVGGNVN